MQIRFGKTDYRYKTFPSPRVPCRKSKQGDLGAEKRAEQTVVLGWWKKGAVLGSSRDMRHNTSQQKRSCSFALCQLLGRGQRNCDAQMVQFR